MIEKLGFVLVLIIALIAINFLESSYAVTIEYEVFRPKILVAPTVCTIVPDLEKNPLLSKNYFDRMLKETKTAVFEWETKLKAKSPKNPDNWEINYVEIPVNKQEAYNYEGCHMFIQFQDKPDDENKWISTLGESEFEFGSSGRTNIIVYYQNIGGCHDESRGSLSDSICTGLQLAPPDQ